MRSERWRTLFPRESRPAPRADLLGLADRPARQQRAAAARRRARAHARALPRVGPAAHGGAGDGRRRARLRPRRDRRRCSSRSPRSCPTRPWRGASRCSRSRSWRLAAVVVAVLAIAPARRIAGDLLLRLPVLRTRGGVVIDSLRTGLAALRDRQLAAVALLWTLASWLVLAFAGWCVLQAFDLAPALARRALPARRRHVRAGRARERGLGRRVRARRALGARRLRRAARGRALGRPRAARGERAAVHRARRDRHGAARHLRAASWPAPTPAPDLRGFRRR